MNERVLNSRHIQEKYKVEKILISYSNSLVELGSFSFQKIIKYIRLFCLLIRKLLTFKPQLVYFQPSLTGIPFYRDSMLIWLTKIFKVNLLLHFRVKGFSSRLYNSLIMKYYQAVFRNTNIIVLSSILIDEVKMNLNINPIVIHNGYPDRYLADSNYIKTIDLLFLANLFISKGIWLFLEILNLLKSKGYKYSASIVGGEGDVKIKEIEEFLWHNELTQMVSISGFLQDKDKDEILSKSKILVYPTFDDAFPGVVIDGMQFCLPVVASNQGSIPIMIDDGVNGFVVKDNNLGSFVNKLEVLLNDNSLIKKMGENGRKKYLANFTFEIFENNMVSIFNQLSI